jgi:hypothetical protein
LRSRSTWSALSSGTVRGSRTRLLFPTPLLCQQLREGGDGGGEGRAIAVAGAGHTHWCCFRLLLGDTSEELEVRVHLLDLVKIVHRDSSGCSTTVVQLSLRPAATTAAKWVEVALLVTRLEADSVSSSEMPQRCSRRWRTWP